MNDAYVPLSGTSTGPNKPDGATNRKYIEEYVEKL